ncbi:MAG: C40 family peptidase [Bacteroidota bacterium]
MSRTGIILLLGLTIIGFSNQRCSSLQFYESPSTATRTPEAKSTSTKPRTTSNYGLEKGEKLRREVIAYAKQHIGVNYKYGGTTPNGFDCSGFTSHVLSEFNIRVSRSSRDQSKQGKSVQLKKAKPGDLIFFSRSGRIFHVAMVAANKNGDIQIIHSTSSRGVVVDHLNTSKYWFPKIHSIKDVSSI